MKMKRLLIFIGVIFLIALAACTTGNPGTSNQPAQVTEDEIVNSPDNNTENGQQSNLDKDSDTDSPYVPVQVRVGVMKGPTAIGLVEFMGKAESEEISSNNFNFEISAAIDEMVPKIVQGNVDIAAVPANMAAVLFNNTQGRVQVLAINTLGMMYILEKSDVILSVEDLRGKTIFASGKGASPEFVLNYILMENGLDPERDLSIEWKSEHTECVAALSTNDDAIAILPQPFVTIALRSNESIRIALDLNQEWDRLQETSDNPSALVTGVVIARSEFASENPEAISDFLDRYAHSVEYVNSNIVEAAAMVGEYDIVPEAIAREAIPFCNITFIEGQEMMDKLSGYLSVLFEQNPQSVGGSLPSDEFYWFR